MEQMPPPPPMAEASIKLVYQTVLTETYEASIIGRTIITVVTIDALAVTAWIDEINSLPEQNGPGRIVGFDVERTPDEDEDEDEDEDDDDEEREGAPIGIVQLCVGSRCLIYRIYQRTGPIPASLIHFMSNVQNTFVGVRIHGLLEDLEEDYGIGKRVHYVDLGVAAAERFGRSDLKNPWISELATAVLGRTVVKPYKHTQWEGPLLKDDDVLYATIDPFLSFEIGYIMLSH